MAAMVTAREIMAGIMAMVEIILGVAEVGVKVILATRAGRIETDQSAVLKLLVGVGRYATEVGIVSRRVEETKASGLRCEVLKRIGSW